MTYTSLEICAGAGGQALGLEMAGFDHQALVEYDVPCPTLSIAGKQLEADDERDTFPVI